MAKKEATLILRFKDAASRELDRATKGIRGAFDRIVITAGDVVNAIKAIGAQTLELVQDASRFDTVKTAFENMAAAQGQDADKMLAKMRELSMGTISDLKLMQQANTALLLGLPVDRFGDMLTIARSSAKATGESMEFMLNSIVTGLGRGSKLMLDNLGIVFDVNKAYEEYGKVIGKTAEQMTDAEKKQAFINKALEVGAKNAQAAGGGVEDLNDKMARLKAQSENAAIVIGKLLSPAFEALVGAGDDSVGMFQRLLVSNSVKSIFLGLATTIDGLVLGFGALFKSVGTFIGGVGAAAVEVAKGNFSTALEIFKSADQEAGQIQQDANQKWLDNRSAWWDKLNGMDDERRKEQLDKIRQDASEKAAVQAEADLELQEQQVERDLAEQQRVIDMQGATYEQLLQIQLKALQDQFKASDDFNKRKQIAQRMNHIKEAQLELKQAEVQKQIDEKKERDRASSLARIATMSRSSNKALALIGKAAALTQIAIETPVAVSKAFSAFPPPFNYVAAGAVGAAMAAQAAQVAGIQLAEGGIVPATPGGVSATIGEGGRSEAVIPLPDDFDPDQGGIGGGVNITFTGPVLGDAAQAREFAKVLDEAFLDLRRSNESVSMEGLT